jgi:bacillithiol system protein YtxJ
MEWRALTDVQLLAQIQRMSHDAPQLVFKHSTRCSISSYALRNLEMDWQEGTPVNCWLLDLLRHRDVSNAIAGQWKVVHESPQAIVINKGRVVYAASHHGIRFSDILAVI